MGPPARQLGVLLGEALTRHEVPELLSCVETVHSLTRQPHVTLAVTLEVISLQHDAALRGLFRPADEPYRFTMTFVWVRLRTVTSSCSSALDQRPCRWPAQHRDARRDEATGSPLTGPCAWTASARSAQRTARLVLPR